MPVPTAVPPTGNSSRASTATPGPADRSLQLPRQSADLLTERKRRGVGQVRAADLQNVLPLRPPFRPSTLPQCSRAGISRSRIAAGHGHVDGRGKHVVGALAQVDVVVRMDRLLAAEAVAAGQFDRPIGDHLVGVHVARGARAGLKDVDGKLVVELAVGHFAAGGQQGLDLAFVERPLAGAVSRPRSRLTLAAAHFTSPRAWINSGGKRPAGDGKVFHGALRLRPVVRLGGQADLAHRIAFDAKLGHLSLSSPPLVAEW